MSITGIVKLVVPSADLLKQIHDRWPLQAGGRTARWVKLPVAMHLPMGQVR